MAIPCICGGGWARHHVITSHAGKAPKAVDGFGNGTVTNMAQFIHVQLRHSS